MGSPPDVQPPPEAILLRRRREAMLMSPEDLSEAMRDASGRRPISGRRIREIEAGRTRAGKPTAAPDLTLVSMALALGITAEELEEVGRCGAAEVLREHVRQRAEDEPHLAAVASSVSSPSSSTVAGSLDQAAVTSQLIQLVIQGVDEIRTARGLTAKQRAELERQFLERFQRSGEALWEDLHSTLRVVQQAANTR